MQPEQVTHATPRTESTRVACLHCGTTFVAIDDDERFCCGGCASVYGLLHAQGLDRYYDLRGGTATPAAPTTSSARDLKWLEVIEQSAADASSGPHRIVLDVQGLHCAACVWLLEELFRRHEGALRIEVNPALGRVELLVAAAFPTAAYVREVEAFGYLFGPPLKVPARSSNALVVRIGVCAALALNAMIFALPLYLGLRSGPTHQLFRILAFVLGSATVLVGGRVFIASAWRAARRRVLHLDQPIAIGIVLAFAGSAWAFATGRDGSGAYFDTVSVFITLMLVGRWLQERVVESNRRYLLASDGVDGLLARRVRDGHVVELVKCREIASGDVLLVSPGDVVPVDGVLDDERATCSLDWISGESAASEFGRGATVPAGAFNAGSVAITVRAKSEFAGSALIPLLRAPLPRGDDAARATPWWRRLAGAYVVGVLVTASAGFTGWFVATGDAHRAIEIATAILVVTCPCAFGLATPMAYELVQAGLRRAGLFVRSPSFLDRATSVRRVVFDKTGTLTTGSLRLANPEALRTLDECDRDVLFNLVVRSTHPKSAAVRRAFDDSAVRFDGGLAVIERAGQGLEATTATGTYRLGTSAWAAAGTIACDDTVFTRDGRVLAALRTDEQLRPDARGEIASLTARGYDVWILSGDARERVAAMADTLGIARDRAIGGCSPDDKAAWLAAHDHRDTLMVGDGINDALAVERAFCAGTPAIDRPFMPARTDFYVVTAGLHPIGLALAASHALARINRRNFGIAVAYNAGAVALCLAGRMSPLLCAVLMPISSLGILLATTASLSGRSPLWKSSSSRSS